MDPLIVVAHQPPTVLSFRDLPISEYGVVTKTPGPHYATKVGDLILKMTYTGKFWNFSQKLDGALVSWAMDELMVEQVQSMNINVQC